jgi:hypothetical protein
MALVELEVRLVLRRADLGRLRQVQPVRIVAAPPARWIMMRRNASASLAGGGLWPARRARAAA